jgi:outer membrane protein assembly factor BamB
MFLKRTTSLPGGPSRALVRYALSGILAALCYAAPCRARVDVLTQHNNLNRTGANLNETILTPANVNGQHFGMLIKHVVDDQVYSQPLIATDVRIGGGRHDVVYITTVNNSVYAFDANDVRNSAPLWHVNFGTPANVNDFAFGCTDINGNMGITGTPVIDKSRGVLYVVALTRLQDHFVQRLHALDITTGVDLPGSPAPIEAQDFDPLMQNQRPALALANGQVYVGYSSHCDKEPYHGFLIAYDATSLQQTGVFNTTPTGEEGSIWQSGQAPAVDDHGNLYVVTGNGSWDGVSNFGESFLKLDPHLHLLDWFTPTNHAYLDSIDADLNSSGAMLVPGTHEVMDGGKQGVLYIVNTEHMGHFGDEQAIEHFQATGSHLHSIVYWDSARVGRMIYMWGQKDHLRAYRFHGDQFDPTPFAMRPEANQGHPGAMLSLSAQGSHDGILWAAIHATGDSWHESRPGILHAYDADNIMHELWNSLQDPQRDDCGNYSKMAPPTIANGKVYLPSFGTQNTGSGQLCIYGLLPNGPVPQPPAGLHAAARNGRAFLEWAASGPAITYDVRKSTNQGQSFATIASGLTSPAFEDIAVTLGKDYVYRVSAVNSSGESVDSTAAAISFPRPLKVGPQH